MVGNTILNGGDCPGGDQDPGAPVGVPLGAPLGAPVGPLLGAAGDLSLEHCLVLQLDLVVPLVSSKIKS